MLKELFDFIKGLILIGVYTLGYRDSSSRRDSEEMKADLNWRNSVDQKREEIRARYRDLKTNYPDDWDGIEQLRKASEMRPSDKANLPTDSSSSKN